MKVEKGIAYYGVLEEAEYESVKCNQLFKQILIEECFEIPNEKPDMEAIISIMVEGKILSSKLIKAPTNRKIIIHGILEIKITYTQKNPEQSVHSAHFTKPFSTFINCLINLGCEDFCNCGSLKSNVYIEDIDTVIINERKFNLTVLILIVLKNCCKNIHCSKNNKKE